MARTKIFISSVPVMLFRDRLEVWNPGHLPFGLTIQKLHGPHKSLPHNPLIAEAMFLRKYIEKAGTGTEDILNKCMGYGLKQPEFFQEEDFRVVIYREPKEDTEGGQKSNQKGGQKNDAQNCDNKEVGTIEGGQKSGQKSGQKKHRTIDFVYSFLKTNPFITREQLAKSLGISQSAVQKHLQKLKNDGRIIRIGAAKGDYWEVCESLPLKQN